MHDGESGWWDSILNTKATRQEMLLIFADWLQDRDDDRAEGVRAIGRLKLWPWAPPGFKGRKSPVGWTYTETGHPYGYSLTRRWFFNLDVTGLNYATVQEAIEDAARAFGKLPEDDRRRLLAGAGKV